MLSFFVLTYLCIISPYLNPYTLKNGAVAINPVISAQCSLCLAHYVFCTLPCPHCTVHCALWTALRWLEFDSAVWNVQRSAVQSVWAVQCSSVQCSVNCIVQCSTVQCSVNCIVQCSTVQCELWCNCQVVIGSLVWMNTLVGIAVLDASVNSKVQYCRADSVSFVQCFLYTSSSIPHKMCFLYFFFGGGCILLG